MKTFLKQFFCWHRYKKDGKEYIPKFQVLARYQRCEKCEKVKSEWVYVSEEEISRVNRYMQLRDRE